jgi:Superfamily I DNA and RNA helicases
MSPTDSDWPSLNDAQRAAVHSSLDPQLVVAGPGTGKTRVLVCRAAHLIAERGFDPGEIVLVTFTRRAAAQLIERLAGIVGRDGRNVRAGTLHHFCYEILQEHAGRADVPEDFVVVDETTTDPWWQGWYEQNKDWCDEHDLGSYRQVQTHVGRVKLGIDAVSGRLQEGMRQYQEMLRERNAVDFSDLLVGARDLLQSEEARAAVTEETGAVLVDEFQDTDPVQYEILRRLGEDVHLFCVADGDQSVYRFRGARPENLQRYIDDFQCSREEGSLQVLGTNYRTSAAIYDVAEGVLDGSTRIKSRGDVRAQRREDGKVRLKGCGNPETERRFVLETVRKWIREEGVPRREIAVLTRWNSRARELEEAFLKEGIACRTSSSDDLMETPPARKLQALLRVVDARRRGQTVGPPLTELLGQMLPERTMTAIRDFGARAMPDRTLWTVFQTIVSDARARRSAHLSDEKAQLERVYATISNLLQQSKEDGLTIGEYVQTALGELEDPLQLLQREEPVLEDPKEYPSIHAAGTALRKWKRAQGIAQGDPNGPRLLLHSRTPQITRLWRQLARRALGVETDPPAPLPEKQEALFGRPTDEGIPPLGADDLVVTSDLDGLFDWGERTGAFENGDQSPQIIVLTGKDIRLGSGQLPMGIDPETVLVVRPEGTIKSPSVQLFKALQAATSPTDPSPVFPEYVMVDIEATSLDPKTCHVAEIGAVKVEGGTPTARFSELVQLPEDLPPEEKETLREVCGLDPERDFGVRPSPRRRVDRLLQLYRGETSGRVQRAAV